MFQIASAFALLFITSAITPGPDTMTIFSRALSGGRFSAAPFTLGIVLAKLTLLTFALSGLAAIAQTFNPFLIALKFAGVIYLLWMGMKTWHKSGIPQAHVLAEDVSPRDSIIGYSLGISNPQAIIFYIAVLPNVIGSQHVGLATYFVLCLTLTCAMILVASIYTLLAVRLRSLFQSTKAHLAINRIAGSVMIGVAIIVALRA